MRKIIGIIWWAIILGFSIISFTHAYTQEEISAYNWAYKNGITTQSSIDSANLNWKLTRQELSKMLANYIENVAWVKQTSYSSCYFTDEDKMTPNLKPYTRKICSYWIMWTNWQDFRPTSKVNRAELWTTISRMLWGDRYDVGGKEFYIYHLNALKDQWIMNNIDNPAKSLARRWDTFIMLKRLSDKFGSNINLNGWNYTYSWNYISNTSSTIHAWNDETKYYYDKEFLKWLKLAAEKKWESDLAKYLEIESKYYVDGIDSLDFDNLPELLDIDEDLDIDIMTKWEKEDLLKKIKSWINKIIKETKTKNNEYLSELKKVIKNISDDKFSLKEKYEKTEWFVEVTNSFLDLYSEIILNLLEMELTADEEEIDDEEWMAVVFWLMWSALVYQSESENYRSYLEDWAKNTINILWWESSSITVTYSHIGNSSVKTNSPQGRSRDVARKNDLAQIQTAIITSQCDRWYWPGKDRWVTKWIDVSTVERELLDAWMSMVPSDPVGSNTVKWLWNYSASKWEYWYMVSTRNGVREGGFVLMANTEVEWWSNRVVCKNGQWLNKWYISEGTDLKDIHTCREFTKWNTCSSNADMCTYTSEEELRYILLY